MTGECVRGLADDVYIMVGERERETFSSVCSGLESALCGVG